MTDFSQMGKTELRAACKEAGISYGKLDNAGMRAALAAKEAPGETYEQKCARIKAHTYHPDELEVMPWDGVERDEAHATDGFDVRGHCPHCGIHLSNGYSDYASACDHNRSYAGKMVREFECLACGGEYGPKIQRKVKTEADRHTGTGLRIEKVREKRNGVTRPSAGGKCAVVWDYLDSLVAAGTNPTMAMVRAEAEKHSDWNGNNAAIELYNWRKFMGITGRVK